MSKPLTLQAVFWDMDGTLVDTEPYWIAAEHELVEAHGGTWTQEQALLLVGQALEFSASVLQDAGVDMDAEAIIRLLMDQVISKCREQMPWRPGARELIAETHAAGVRQALVTMSWTPLAQVVMDALPEGHLDFMVTGDMVSRGKPDPEAYTTAFAKMATDHAGEPLQLRRCLAIEDSVPGTAAAAASGLVTLGVPHTTPLPHSGQWHVAESVAGLRPADLEALLERQPAAVEPAFTA